MSLGLYLSDVKSMLRERMVVAVIGINVFTSMASLATLTFLPVYLTEELGYTKVVLGFHIGLLYAMGAVSQPILGRLSDRFGRKAVLVPSLFLFSALYLLLALAAPGLQLALVVAAMGLFFYALATVTQAAVMDVASDRVQASTMGITSLFGQLLTLPSPILASLVVNHWGLKAAFVYSGVVVLLGAFTLVLTRIPRAPSPGRQRAA